MAEKEWELGMEIINLNRTVSVLLTTLLYCAFFVLFYIRHHMWPRCVCQHNTVNNKEATVVIGVGKSWNSFEGERIFIHFNDQALYWLFRKSNIQPARQKESFPLRCNFMMVSGTIRMYNPQTDIKCRHRQMPLWSYLYREICIVCSSESMWLILIKTDVELLHICRNYHI